MIRSAFAATARALVRAGPALVRAFKAAKDLVVRSWTVPEQPARQVPNEPMKLIPVRPMSLYELICWHRANGTLAQFLASLCR